MKCIAIICIVLGYVQGHGRLLQPPSRASMWRFGFDNPRDDTDNEGNCGGRSVRFLYLSWRFLELSMSKKRQLY